MFVKEKKIPNRNAIMNKSEFSEEFSEKEKMHNLFGYIVRKYVQLYLHSPQSPNTNSSKKKKKKRLQ